MPDSPTTHDCCRADLTATLVSRRVIDCDGRRVHRLLADTAADERVALFVPDGGDPLSDLGTARTYRFAAVAWCDPAPDECGEGSRPAAETGRHAGPSLASFPGVRDAVDRLELAAPVGILDRQTTVRAADDREGRPPDGRAPGCPDSGQGSPDAESGNGDGEASGGQSGAGGQLSLHSQVLPADDGDRRQPSDGTDLERASALREAAVEAPETVEPGEIAALLGVDDAAVRLTTLLALHTWIDARPDDASACLPAVRETLASDDEAIRNAGLNCLERLADRRPEAVTPVADAVIATIGTETADAELAKAIPFVANVAAAEPSAVVDAVPRLAAVLQNGTPREKLAILALQRIATAHPEAVLPVTTQLRAYVEDADAAHPVAALAAIGTVGKAYPNTAVPAIPRATELLAADSPYRRANAAALLADLAGTYPAEVRPVVPRVVPLLGDDDERARHNAVTILARVAREYPADVRPLTTALVEALDDDLALTRRKACWALGYLRASEARGPLAARRDGDPDDDVRSVAAWALDEIADVDG